MDTFTVLLRSCEEVLYKLRLYPLLMLLVTLVFCIILANVMMNLTCNFSNMRSLWQFENHVKTNKQSLECFVVTKPRI